MSKSEPIMKTSNTSDSRYKSRRIEERRRGCRRLIKHAFGTEQWIKAVQSTYLLWPKEERRTDERRSVSRRLAERRVEVSQYRNRTRRPRILKQYIQQPMLTAEEKALLNELNKRF
jgi:hypothetical protein